MEVQPPLFVAVNGQIGPDELGLPYRDLFAEGVLSDIDLEVSAPGGMVARVAKGAAWIAGDDNLDAQPTYRVRNDANVDLAIAASDPANPRKDIVIAEVLDATFSGASYSWRLRVVPGVPAGAPAEPALPNNAIKLAVVTVPAAAVAIITANIDTLLGRVRRRATSALHAPAARVYRATNESIANATWTAITFLAERFDTEGMHDLAVNAHALVCRRAGKYLLGAGAAFDSNATGRRELAILVNGVYVVSDSRPAISAGVSVALHVTTLYELAVGDSVQVNAYQDSGGALNIFPSANYTPEFWAVRVG